MKPFHFPTIGPAVALLLGGLTLGAPRAFAYPEFQAQILKQSGRTVNCALCHVNSDGPEGAAPGQIGHLNAAEMERLGQARAAFQPGVAVDSPILNAFGNHLIKSLGKTKFLELRVVPAQLSDALPKESDLDHDGISDAQEIRDGTHPLNRNDGNPWLLFQHNFRENFGQIVLTLAATCAGIYGLIHLLNGFANAMRLKREDSDEASH